MHVGLLSCTSSTTGHGHLRWNTSSLTALIPLCLGGSWAIGKCRGTDQGMGKHSLETWESQNWFRDPWICNEGGVMWFPGSWITWTTESCRSVENGVRLRAESSWGSEEALASPSRESPRLGVQRGLLLWEIRLWLCRQRSSPWLPMVDPDVKRQLVFLTSLLSWQKLDV